MCGFCVNCVKDGGEQKVVLNSCAMLCHGGVRVPSTIVTLNQGYLSTFQPFNLLSQPQSVHWSRSGLGFFRVKIGFF